ncbi:hypothetical protein [Spongiactinospora sp. TRM90649]|uniref:hypothetical protein n=1 Tax=Spongiactinospora sp. TRM90649 TaxID=3031114 RepID=UPI0023F8F73E|nr:hypothetical protein [Spongiactinospora sp. TRM90649]MDF5751389.1 hypothetical protein [Spongiactinospora sp. TRM90649]
MGTWGFLEFDHGIPADHILTELSRDSRVWTVTLGPRGHCAPRYTAGGKTRAEIQSFVFGDHIVEMGDPSVLADFRTTPAGLDPEDFDGRRAAALAFVEAATGMGIEGEWPDADEAPVAILDNPGRLTAPPTASA